MVQSSLLSYGAIIIFAIMVNWMIFFQFASQGSAGVKGPLEFSPYSS